MTIVIILSTLVFATVLSLIEIPKMLKSKSYREFWSFSVLLGFGVTLAILKSIGVSILNPSDLLAWIFSPLTDFINPFFR